MTRLTRAPLLPAVALLTAFAACAESDRRESRPNLLLVTIDTLRADRLGCYGDRQARTPNLDAVCAEGWRLEPAVTPAPLTLPAHATILTGLEPFEHGIRGNGAFRLRDEFETLAEYLKRAGYATGAFVGAFPLDRRFGLNQGFDEYDDETDPAAEGFHYRERRAERVVAAASVWLARQRALPFFAWVHVYDPHDPYDPPVPYARQFAQDPYRGEVAYADAMLGRLFQTLKSEGRWEHTVVVVTADHGEGLEEHGEGTHGFFVYEPTMRVPLIIKKARGSPGQQRPGRGVARLADIFPTALYLLGQPVPPGTAGANLAGGPMEVEAYGESLAPQLDYNWAPLFSLRTERWKFIAGPTPELYDLQADPRELHNLAESDEGRQTSARLNERLDRIRRLPGEPTARARMRPDRDTVSALQALGYVGGTAEASQTDQGKDPKQMLPLAREIDAISDLRPEQLHETVRRLEALRQRDPRNNLIQRRLATAYERAGNWARAAESYDRAMGLGYITEDIVVATVRAYVRAGAQADRRSTPAAADRAFQRALALAPDDADALEARGVWLARRARIAEAGSLFRRALERAPDRWQPHYQLGMLALRQNNLPAALRDLEAARGRSPENPDVLFALGEACRRSNQLGRAGDAFGAFLKVAPASDAGRRALAARFLERRAREPR